MKKVLKFVKFLVLGLVLLLLVTIGVTWISNRIFLGSTDPTNIDYLRTHQLRFHHNGSAFNLTDFLSPGFFQSQVILLGEPHGVADIQYIDKMLLAYLNQKMGIRYYIAEMDSTRAEQLNRFLSGPQKDTALLLRHIHELKQRIPQQASRELMDKWMAVYNYNTYVPDSLRIRVIGIDKGWSDTRTGISRDSVMWANLQHVIREKGLEKEKFYGLFGLFHTMQAPINKGARPFASRMRDAGLIVTSMVCYTTNSQMYMPKGQGFPVPDDEKIGFLNADGPFMLVKGIEDVKAVAARDSIHLFNLMDASSPYLHHQQLGQLKSRLFGADIMPASDTTPTTRLFQYLFFIDGSEALTPVR